MRRNAKKKRKFSPVLKYIVSGIFVIFVVSVIVIKGMEFIKGLPHFKVKEVVVDPAIPFIRTSTLSRLKGSSIFDVDIKKLSKRLRYQYPQVSDLKVVKNFPDQIYVTAQRRDIYAQAIVNNATVSVDNEGVVLSENGEEDAGLPLIVNIRPRQRNIKIGRKLRGKNIQVALNIIKIFRNNRFLTSLPIKRIDIANLSKIYIFIASDVRVILDQTELEGKLRILGALLSQEKINLDEVNYIDLRFKEPVIRKK